MKLVLYLQLYAFFLPKLHSPFFPVQIILVLVRKDAVAIYHAKCGNVESSDSLKIRQCLMVVLFFYTFLFFSDTNLLTVNAAKMYAVMLLLSHA